MNKLSFLAESTSLVVKELSDLEFSFQSVAKIQKNYNQVNFYLLQAFSHGLEFVAYFLMKEIFKMMQARCSKLKYENSSKIRSQYK